MSTLLQPGAAQGHQLDALWGWGQGVKTSFVKIHIMTNHTKQARPIGR